MKILFFIRSLVIGGSQRQLVMLADGLARRGHDVTVAVFYTGGEIDVAPELSKLPVRAQVVFVVDTSYSVGAEKLAAQLATLRAYVAHVPDAEVEIVATLPIVMVEVKAPPSDRTMAS